MTILNSISNKHWQLPQVSERDVLYIMQKYKLSEIAARIMVSRGIVYEQQIQEFINPLLRNALPDPFHLLDMKKGIMRIMQAIDQKEKIVVFADYDVDGATSSALLKRYFADLGIDILIYIPDRIKEGYGPNIAALLKLKKNGCDLCITVDCGTVAHEPLLKAKQVGLDVIVIDHHLGSEELPEACAIINPNRLDENSDYTYIAAVGVTFLFLVALHKTLREKNFFSSEPNLYNYLDLVALGTVCDVMPLQNLNRVFVAQGLKVMSNRSNLGIRVLADLLEIYEPLTSYHLGFLIGPQINAGGRVGQAELGANLLSSNNESEVVLIAQKLLQYNQERKKLEKIALDEAMQQVNTDQGKVIIVVSESWHPGIIGIVASRIKEHFYLPTIIITIRDGIGKASCRSVTGVDIGALVLAAKLQGLIIEGGGHKMAAGFSISLDKISALQEFLNKEIAEVNIQNIVKIDAITNPQSLNLKLWYDLQKVAPFGSGNPEPKFILSDIIINNAEVLKDQHIRCEIIDKESKKSVRSIAFKVVNSNLGDVLLRGNVEKILGKIKANYWQGRVSINFIIEDAIAKEA